MGQTRIYVAGVDVGSGGGSHVGQSVVAEIHFHKIVLAPAVQEFHAERSVVTGFGEESVQSVEVYSELGGRDEYSVCPRSCPVGIMPYFSDCSRQLCSVSVLMPMQSSSYSFVMYS